MTRESPTPLPDQLSHTVTRQTRARLDALSAVLAFSSFSWNGVCCDMNLLPCRYHDDACFSFVFSTDVAVFGARTLSRSRDLKRRDGLHHNTDVRSMFYVFDTLAVLVLTSIALVADIRCTPEVGERHLLQRPMFSTTSSTCVT